MVKAAFDMQAKGADAYIFCMTTGDPNNPNNPQDMLSQWRAYAQDGRGGALTLKFDKLLDLVKYLTGLRINGVIYNLGEQTRLIDNIIATGDRQYRQTGQQREIDATVASLTYALPLMKHEGFKEEHEWRLIFMLLGDPALLRA